MVTTAGGVLLMINTLQKMPIYHRVDVATSNPRKLFRQLSNLASEMNYIIEYNDVSIEKDPVGETGTVNAKMKGVKKFKHYEYIKDYTIKKTHPLVNLFVFITGTLYCITLIYYALDIVYHSHQYYNFLWMSILMTIATILFYVFVKKNIPVSVGYKPELIVYIYGYGEIYRSYVGTKEFTELSEVDKKHEELTLEQVTTEMTLHIAGDASIKWAFLTKFSNKDDEKLAEKSLEKIIREDGKKFREVVINNQLTNDINMILQKIKSREL